MTNRSKDQQNDDHDDDNHDIQEVSREPGPPDNEYLDPSDGALIRSRFQEWVLDFPQPFLWGDFNINKSLATYLLHRFGPNISSKAIRHALLSDAHTVKFGIGESGLEHSVLSLRYTRDAIHDKAYIDILYASFFMVICSLNRGDGRPNDLLKHAKAFVICLKQISVDVDESRLMKCMLYFILEIIIIIFDRTRFRDSPLDELSLETSQLTRQWANFTPDWRNCPAELQTFEQEARFGLAAKEVRMYLDCWYHLNLVIKPDVNRINRVGYILQNTLLSDFFHPISALCRPLVGADLYTRNDRLNFYATIFLEYILFVAPSIRSQYNQVIHDQAVATALVLGHRMQDTVNLCVRENWVLWPFFLATLLLQKYEGLPVSIAVNVKVDSSTSALVTFGFICLIKERKELDGCRERLLEYFADVSSRPNAWKLEINGTGLYNCMEYLRRSEIFDYSF